MDVESFMNSQKEQSSALFWPPNSLCPSCMKTATATTTSSSGTTTTSKAVRSGLRGPVDIDNHSSGSSSGGGSSGSSSSSSGGGGSSGIVSSSDIVHQFSVDETAILTVLQQLY